MCTSDLKCTHSKNIRINTIKIPIKIRAYVNSFMSDIPIQILVQNIQKSKSPKSNFSMYQRAKRQNIQDIISQKIYFNVLIKILVNPLRGG